MALNVRSGCITAAAVVAMSLLFGMLVGVTAQDEVSAFAVPFAILSAGLLASFGFGLAGVASFLVSGSGYGRIGFATGLGLALAAGMLLWIFAFAAVVGTP